MSFSHHQVPYQNQLQFNLAVPLTTRNLSAHHQHPRPILVERVGGHHVIPANVSPGRDCSKVSASNYSLLSEDRMEMMSQLARRDLRNKKLQEQSTNNVQASASGKAISGKNVSQRLSCSRLNQNQSRRVKHTLRTNESGKNRRLGAVQTPPPRRPTRTYPEGDSFISTPARNRSPDISRDADVYFPVKPFIPEGCTPAKEEVERLQQELEGYLRLIIHVQQRVIEDGNIKFLHPAAKSNVKDGYLDQIEDSGRAQARVNEQNTRSARNIYNLRQKVKQLQRDLAHVDLNNPLKKSQVLNQVTSVHKGAVKSLQTFVNQLPNQNLTGGLPTHYHELALLLRQLTGINLLTQQGRQTQNDLLTLLDDVDTLNVRWCSQQSKPGKATVKNNTKNSGKAWVADTKRTEEFFGQPPKFVKPGFSKQTTSRGRPTQRRPAPQPTGKENRNIANDRKSMLRAGVAALVGQIEGKSGLAWEINSSPERPQNSPERPQNSPERPHASPGRPEHKRGYMLPADLQRKRERAQRAVEISNQRRKAELNSSRTEHYAKATISTTLKHSEGRPLSAPASPKRKEVNFDLEAKSPRPWIPVGSGSGSRSRNSQSRSLSPSRHQHKPFFVGDLDVSEAFSGHNSLEPPNSKRSPVQSYGFRSLPSDGRLRSHQVSDSLIDDIEDRLFSRLKLSGNQLRENKMAGETQGKLWHREDSTINLTDTEFEDGGDLDITDLTDLGENIRRDAVSLTDAPTLENVKLRLAEMQREQREIRQRWSSLKFLETTKRTTSKPLSEQPQQPPAIHVSTALSKGASSKQHQGPYQCEVNKNWSEEPLLFTKPSTAVTKVQFLHTVDRADGVGLGLDRVGGVVGNSLTNMGKKLLSMKQTDVMKICEDRDRYESYLKKHSHHPTGKFDPWKLVEEISDEIFDECLLEVAAEVENINEEIANHMYKSEFAVDKSPEFNTEQISVPSNQPTTPTARAGIEGAVRERVEKVIGEATEPVYYPEVKNFVPQFGDNMLGAGDTAIAPNLDKISQDRDSPVGEKSLSPTRSPVRTRTPSVGLPSPLPSSRQSPNVSGREPYLDNVADFVRDGNESGSGHQGDVVSDLEYEDSEVNQLEEEDYSDEDFEDVSDVDMP